MITFNADGSTTIDFPDGPVTVKAPSFGGLKRLRAERVKLARTAQDDTARWETEHPAPEGTDDDPPDPTAVGRHAEDRSLAAEAANLASTVAWWTLLLRGDDTFKGLAEGTVPSDPDDWPAALLYDIRPVIPPNSSLDVILSAQSTPDRWMRHVGEGHARYGSGPNAGQTTTP